MLTWIRTTEGDWQSGEYTDYEVRPGQWRAVRYHGTYGCSLVKGNTTLMEAKLAAERHSRQMFISGEVKS